MHLYSTIGSRAQGVMALSVEGEQELPQAQHGNWGLIIMSPPLCAYPVSTYLVLINHPIKKILLFPPSLVCDGVTSLPAVTCLNLVLGGSPSLQYTLPPPRRQHLATGLVFSTAAPRPLLTDYYQLLTLRIS
ncbi:hypothetical protein E2C01_053754 [Portunus trituberculatus]|uniref:Uncharacterized protein n=1 Tax=Portunus trituberculatus TaxID=210409 RepID=A0A5B7GQ86_PORTR|nr:hypothetical protein [Portunus trituberculatus]